MSFLIDRQTLDELNLLGKFRNGSVYHLFGQVKTRGAEKLMEKMFTDPLTNASQINERSSIFAYFQRARLSFPFDVQQLNVMREYLDHESGKNLLTSWVSIIVRKGLSVIASDARYKQNIQGLQATIQILSRCHSFIEMMPVEGPFAATINKIKTLLSDSRIQTLRNIDIYTALPLQSLVFHDRLLKGTLKNEMEAILHFIYTVDLNITVSNVAREKRFNYAKAMDGEKNIFSVRDLKHPCIENSVGNAVLLTRQKNILFLTGANMAGKSTLMKSVGIAVYLAHMGFPVAAEEMNFSVREGLYTSINVADNISLGYSHFYAEVVRVKQAAEAAASGKSLMLMFDELFKGTNVKDAFDGTLAVTEGFAEYSECLFIVSTHIIEVGEALRWKDNIDFAFMPTTMEGARPTYSYQLRQGITEDRQGMMIIRNEGILELIGS